LVQLPVAKPANKPPKECTFKPQINKISEEIEKRNWQFRLQLERQGNHFSQCEEVGECSDVSGLNV